MKLLTSPAGFYDLNEYHNHISIKEYDMKAIGFKQCLPIDAEHSLEDITSEIPIVNHFDILVEVKAISVNPVDCKVRKLMPPKNGEYKILGWDAAGIVKAKGEKVTRFEVGDQVFYAGDLTRQGSNAEYQTVDERIVGKMPATLSFAEAAALPLTTITAWEMIFDRLEIPKNQERSVLVIGAAGGVGSIMVQLLKTQTRMNIIGTASREDSIRWIKELGATHVINHKNPLSQELKAIHIPEVDYVISLNYTAEHYPEIIKVIKPQGKIGLIDDPESLDIKALKTKSISLHWEFMYTRSMFQTQDMSEQHILLNKVSRLIDEGQIRTTLSTHLGLINAENLKKAHALLESKLAHGKIVLEGF